MAAGPTDPPRRDLSDREVEGRIARLRGAGEREVALFAIRGGTLEEWAGVRRMEPARAERVLVRAMRSLASSWNSSPS
jgi:hypothetical protein